MSAVVYIARVAGDDRAGYVATFPDLPSIRSENATLTGLLGDVRGALLDALKKLEAQGLEWPAASSMEQLRTVEAAGGEAASSQGALMVIDVQVDDAPVRVNISIGERLLKRVDETAERQSMTRSGYIAAALRLRLGDAAGSKPFFEDASAQRLYDEVAALGRRMNETLGPESGIGRTLNDLDQRALDGLRRLAGGMAAAMERRGRKGEPGPDTRDRPAAE